MSIAIISHENCAAHKMSDSHPESPSRLFAIESEIAKLGLDEQLTQIKAKPIDIPLLALAHEQRYIDEILSNAPSTGNVQLDPDTLMTPFTLNAALYAAGAAVDAVDLVMSDNDIIAAFCATRPPGHHAERDKAMGFCIFNNIAIAALYAQKKYNLQKIAIVDFDVHHGNGTQNIMMDKKGILFCSTFQHPYYPFSGAEQTPNHIINLPLAASEGSREFRKRITDDCIPALETFKPELVLISAGFDAHTEDDIAQLNLNEDDYTWVSKELVTIANKYAGGKIVSVLEGGYSLDALGRSVAAHLKVLMNA